MIQVYQDFNQHTYKYWEFPSGEPQVNIQLDPCRRIVVLASISTSKEIVELFLLLSAINNQKKPCASIILVFSFLPFARQDKIHASGDSHSLLTFLWMLYSLKYIKHLIVYEPHSDSILKTIFDKNITIVNNLFFLNHFINHYDFLICPDKGARRRFEKYNFGLPIVYCEKTRDPSTGKLSGFIIASDGDCVMKNDSLNKGIIIDDICDAGGTFLGLRNLFPTKTVSLAISHGIMSQGYNTLAKRFHKIYLTDSFDSPYDPYGNANVNHIDIRTYLLNIAEMIESIENE